MTRQPLRYGVLFQSGNWLAPQGETVPYNFSAIQFRTYADALRAAAPFRALGARVCEI